MYVFFQQYHRPGAMGLDLGSQVWSLRLGFWFLPWSLWTENL